MTGNALSRPRGILLDYGGTLVEEVGYDLTAGTQALLAMASHVPPGLTLERVVDRGRTVTKQLAARRDTLGVETPWPSLTRLIYDYFGVRFSHPMAALEVAFWDASVTTRAMPGAPATLDAIHAAGVPIAVLSNSAFASDVIRHDLAKHGLADRLAFVMVTADYVVRKPNALLFETAAARLGVPAKEIWFVGDRLDTDVAGARAAGMVSVWLEPTGTRQSDTPDLTPDLAVRDWRELLNYFEAAGR